MEEDVIIQHIIKKIQSGIPFGFFEDGRACHFADGEKVHFDDLWRAVRTMHHLGDSAHEHNIMQLCPETFEGTFTTDFIHHIWKKVNPVKSTHSNI